jgi:uncharacterized membrane protein
MKEITKSVLINAPVEKVYEFLANPENLPAVWPSLVEVKNVKWDPSGKHSFDWTYKMVGIHFHGHADTTQVEKSRRVVSKNEGGIASTFHYTYESKNGGTQLGLRVEYEMPNKVLAKLAEPLVTRLNERETETFLNNVKMVMEHGAKKAA